MHYGAKVFGITVFQYKRMRNDVFQYAQKLHCFIDNQFQLKYKKVDH